MRLRRSWVRWLRTRRLTHRVRRLRKLVLRQEKVLVLQQEYQSLLSTLEHPLPEPETLPTKWLIAPPLTEAEIQALRDSMPDPLEEIRHLLAPSTTPSSPPSWAD